MIRFEVRQPLSPESRPTREAWLDFHRKELTRADSAGERRVDSLAPGRYRVETTGTTRRGSVRTHGVITFDQGTSWSVRTETLVDGRPYAREWARYEVREGDGAREISVSFELVGATRVVDLALNEGREDLKAERERSLAKFMASLEARRPA
jgi:hypothetical protein